LSNALEGVRDTRNFGQQRELQEDSQLFQQGLHTSGQEFTAGQNALGRQHAEGMQQNAFGHDENKFGRRSAFEAGQAATNRSHDFALLGAKTKAEAEAAAAAPPKYGDAAGPLSDNFRSEQTVQDWNEIEPHYEHITQAAQGTAGDITVLYGFMKMLDPGGKVTQGEPAMVADASSLLGRIQLLYNKALAGGALSPDVRKGIEVEAQKMAKVAFDRYSGTYTDYSARGGQYNLKPEDYLPSPSVWKDVGTPTLETGGSIAPTAGTGAPTAQAGMVGGRGAAAQIPPPEQRTVGQVYPTPKGPARWMGDGWELVQ
jgi:hypothetical protein